MKREEKLFFSAIKSNNWPLVQFSVSKCDFDILLLSHNIGSSTYSALKYRPDVPLQKQVSDYYTEIIIGNVHNNSLNHVRIINRRSIPNTNNLCTLVMSSHTLDKITEKYFEKVVEI